MERQPIPREQRLQLGERVKVGRQICPVKTGRRRRQWCQNLIYNNWGKQIEPEGIIVGVRTVYDGLTNINDFDYGSEFEAQKAIGVYLVAIHMGRILRVLPEDVMPLSKGE